MTEKKVIAPRPTPSLEQSEIKGDMTNTLAREAGATKKDSSMKAKKVMPSRSGPDSKWKQLDRIHTEQAALDNPYPDKSFTTAEYAEHFDLSLSTARRLLADLVRQKKLLMGCTRDALGRRRNAVCYWLPIEVSAPPRSTKSGRFSSAAASSFGER